MAADAALADEVLAACINQLSLRGLPRFARVCRRWRDAARRVGNKKLQNDRV